MKPKTWINLIVVFGLLLSPWVAAPGLEQPAQAAPAGTTWYVRPGAAGACNAWDQACELQAALSAAAAGDQIWVAAGTYLPDYDPGTGTHTDDREATFQLVSGVAVYGGFPGTGEPGFGDRNWQAYVTLLSGDIGDPDDSSDNVYHVVTGSGLTETAVLDGFTIRGGNASGEDSDQSGGGMYNTSGSPTLTNVTFSSNFASGVGGGMYNTSGSPTLTNVTFSSNFAFGVGGGMCNDTSSPTLTNVTFSNNSAVGLGGGMFNGTSSPTLANGILWGNGAGVDGDQIYNNNSTPTISYSDIQGSGGSLAWDASLGDDGGGNIDADPLFVDAAAGDLHLRLDSPAVDAGDNGAVPPEVTTDLDGNPRIGNGRVDMGAYEFQYPEPPSPIHVDGSATGARDGSDWPNALTSLRFALAWAGVGVTEYGLPGVEIWVAGGTYKPTVGADREATFQLHRGVAVYGGFAGTETSRDQRNPDPATNNTVLSGDLLGNDSPDSATRGENSYHVVTGSGTDATAVLDGFAVSGGFADGADPHDRGGGMYNTSGSPTLANLTFSGNATWGVLPGTPEGGGGGMYNYNESSPTLNNVTFSGNTATWYGGGMSNREGSNPSLTNVTFSNNYGGAGGGMYNEMSSPTLTNVTFSNNYASDGGGMSNQEGSNPSLTDCTFSGNTARAPGYPGTWGPHGGGMANYHSSPVLINVTFDGNSVIVDLPHSVMGSGGGMYSYSGSPQLTGVTFSDNSADRGGGLLSGSATLTGVTFSGNSAHDGGGMFTYGNPALTDVAFRNNVADTLGGGMFTYGNPALTDCTFEDNAAGLDGGGIYNIDGELSLANVTFSDNQAADGGGIYNASGIMAGINVTITTNTATHGGGIYNDGGALTGSNVTVATNTADHGGGMYNTGNPTVTHVTISSNTATGNGGGVYNDGGAPELARVSIISNTATHGGGMYNQASGPTLTNVHLRRNTATGNGGGMYNDGGTPALTHVSIISNTATQGGGMYNQASSPTLTNVNLRRNTATSHGGGMYNLDYFGTAIPKLTNVLFNANAATDAAQGSGGGMYNEGSDPELTNVTFIHNRAKYGGGMANFSNYQDLPSNPALRNSLLWGNTGVGTLYAQQVYNEDDNNQPFVQGSTIQDQDLASPFVDADGADNIPGTEDDDLRPTYPSYGIVDGGGDDLLPADDFDLDGDDDETEKLSLDLADSARIYADYDFDGQADDPAVLGTDGIDQVDQGAYEAGCHPWHMQMGDPLLAEGRKYRTGFHSDLVEGNPAHTISGTLESYANQQAGKKFTQAGKHYEAALTCAETVTQTHQALLGLQNVLWEQATAAMLRGNEEMVGALDVTISGGVRSIEDDIAALERAAGLYDQATDGYLRASRDFPQFLASLQISRTLPITYTEVFTQVDVQRLAMAAAKKSRATLELGELQFRNGDREQAGGTLSQGYGEGLLELNLLVSLWPEVAETVDYVTLVQNLGGMDRLYSYLQSGKNPFGYGSEFVPFHYRPDKDPQRGSNNFEHTHWIAGQLYLAPAIADATQAELTKRMFDDDYETFQAKLNDIESTYNSELEILCGTAGGAPDLDVCDGGTIQEQYQKVLGAKLRVEQVLVQMEMNNAKIQIEQQRAADLCEIELALAEVMLENGEQLAILSEQEARLRFAKSESQGILGTINGCITGFFGGAGAVGEMKAAPGLSFAMGGLGAIWGGFNAYLDHQYQKEVADKLGDVYAKKERIYALEKAQVHYANCDKVQVESLAHLKTIVLEFANLEMEHAIAMNELMQALSRLNGLTSRAEYLLAEKAKARAFTQLLYQDPAGRVLRNHLMEQAYFSFERALHYGFRAGRALDYEINSDVPYSGYPSYPLRTLDDLYAINSTDELADGLLQMSQAWEAWTAGRFPESRTAIVYLSRALFEEYQDPATGETVTARDQFNAFIRGRTDPDALTLHFETSILQGNKFVPTWYYNDRIDSIKMRVRGEDLSLCPQPPQYVDVNLLQAGTSFIRTEDATLRRVEGRIEIDVEDIREYDLEPKSVSVQAALNDDPFPDPGGTIEGFVSRSVAFADWTLTIDTTQGAENPCLNLDNVDEIELHIVRQAYDLPLPPGLGPEEEELLAAVPVPEYQPSRKVLPPISLAVSPPEWAIPGLSTSSGPVNLDGVYVGTIVISQPLYLPPVDLALVLSDDGGSLSGYISPTLSYPLMPGTDHGPQVTGAWSGEGFSLQSETFTTVITTGVVISHQVLLHTGVISDSGGVLSGVYSETLAGLTPEPLATVGEFWLLRPHPPVSARIYLPLVVRSAP